MKVLSIFFCFLCFADLRLFAELQPGTLIVSYQTGPIGERLDRVRFRLIDDSHHWRFFPKGSEYASEAHHRIVAIDDVQAGTYTLEFLIPNTDGLFAEISPRSVTVLPGERVQIDQYFHPRYGSLTAEVETAPTIAPFVVLPSITLEDEYREIRAQSLTGKLFVKYLTPGSYTLRFQDLPGYVTPEPIVLAVQPFEEMGPFVGSYGCEFRLPHQHFDSIPSKSGCCLTSTFRERKSFLGTLPAIVHKKLFFGRQTPAYQVGNPCKAKLFKIS